MPTAPPKTKPSTRKLSDLARHLNVPEGVTSTGWPAVHKTCREKLGITFDDWQDSAGRLILSKTAVGALATTVDGVGLSLPRQVGKTYLVGALVFALCVNTPGLLVIWSAHHARTHAETFLAMQDFAKRRRVAPHVQQVYTGAGTEEIRLHNGSRILFGARERGFGRGIPGVDVLIFDEAQILSDKALANMLATLNTSTLGLHLYIGTPPKPEDMSEAFTRMRTDALKGDLTQGAWIEFGAEPGSDPNDRKQWARANPSYPLRTPATSIQRLQRKLAPADFLREAMGIWDETLKTQSVVSSDIWRDLGTDSPPANAPTAFGLDMSHDRVVSIGVCVRDGDSSHVEVAALDQSPDPRGVVEWLVEAAGRKTPVVVDSYSPAASLVPALEEAGVKVKVISSGSEMAKACGGFFDAVNGGTLSHFAQQALDDAVAGARKRNVGTAGGWAWDRKNGAVNLAPLVSVTLARYGAMAVQRKKTGSEAGSRVVVLS